MKQYHGSVPSSRRSLSQTLLSPPPRASSNIFVTASTSQRSLQALYTNLWLQKKNIYRSAIQRQKSTHFQHFYRISLKNPTYEEIPSRVDTDYEDYEDSGDSLNGFVVQTLQLSEWSIEGDDDQLPLVPIKTSKTARLSKTKPSKSKLSKTKPSKTKPSKTKPSKTKPSNFDEANIQVSKKRTRAQTTAQPTSEDEDENRRPMTRARTRVSKRDSNIEVIDLSGDGELPGKEHSAGESSDKSSDESSDEHAKPKQRSAYPDHILQQVSHVPHQVLATNSCMLATMMNEDFMKLCHAQALHFAVMLGYQGDANDRLALCKFLYSDKAGTRCLRLRGSTRTLLHLWMWTYKCPVCKKFHRGVKYEYALLIGVDEFTRAKLRDIIDNDVPVNVSHSCHHNPCMVLSHFALETAHKNGSRNVHNVNWFKHYSGDECDHDQSEGSITEARKGKRPKYQPVCGKNPEKNRDDLYAHCHPLHQGYHIVPPLW